MTSPLPVREAVHPPLEEEALERRGGDRHSGSSAFGEKRIPRAATCHGRRRPAPPPASSTKPYFASWRRWNEHVVGDSPISSPASVAVRAPCRPSTSRSDSRTGWVTARSSRASVSRRGSSSSSADSTGLAGAAARLMPRPAQQRRVWCPALSRRRPPVDLLTGSAAPGCAAEPGSPTAMPASCPRASTTPGGGSGIR